MQRQAGIKDFNYTHHFHDQLNEVRLILQKRDTFRCQENKTEAFYACLSILNHLDALKEAILDNAELLKALLSLQKFCYKKYADAVINKYQEDLNTTGIKEKSYLHIACHYYKKAIDCYPLQNEAIPFELHASILNIHYLNKEKNHTHTMWRYIQCFKLHLLEGPEDKALIDHYIAYIGKTNRAISYKTLPASFFKLANHATAEIPENIQNTAIRL